MGGKACILGGGGNLAGGNVTGGLAGGAWLTGVGNAATDFCGAVFKSEILGQKGSAQIAARAANSTATIQPTVNRWAGWRIQRRGRMAAASKSVASR